MYGAPMPKKPDLIGWKLVADQAFYKGFAVGASAVAALCVLGFFVFIMEIA